MPVLKPVPVMLFLVMLAAPDPLLVTFTVNVTGVLITCDPNPRLGGVAVRLGEPGATGVGLGVGVGPGGGAPPFDLVAPAPPPQPIMHIRKRTKRRTTLECLLAILVLCKGTPQLRNTQLCIGLIRSECSLGYFINSTTASQDITALHAYRSTMHSSARGPLPFSNARKASNSPHTCARAGQ